MTDSARLQVDVDLRAEVPGGEQINDTFVARVLEAAAERIDVRGEVSVSFVTDEEIHQLNRDYRGVDRATDVLSFALSEGEEFPETDENASMLGDVIISVEKAQEQAEAYGHTFEREVAFLLVHGFLHLNGYDHGDEVSERDMFGLQEQVLDDLGITREVNRDHG